MIKSFKELVEKTKSLESKTKVAVCCAHDLLVLDAVVHARRAGIVDGILIGDAKKIRQILAELDEDETLYEIVDCPDVEKTVEIAAGYVQRGEAGVIMKGNMQSADILKGVLKDSNGLKDSEVLSVCGNYEMKDLDSGESRILSVTDPALNISPNLDTKKQMLQNAVKLRHALGERNTKVAVIAPVEFVNPKIPETVDAQELAQMNKDKILTGCTVEGPMSFDLALNMQSVHEKGYKGSVAGHADLLVMPSLVSANVLVKCLTDVANLNTAGLVLGAKVPIVLTSRSARPEDKFYSIAMAAYVGSRHNKSGRCEA